MKSTEERVGIIEAEEIRGLIELKRPLDQVMMRKIAPCFLKQLPERHPARRQPAL